MHTDWKNRMENWEPEPPAAVWERLSEQLEDADQTAFAKRLYDFSAAPPSGIWDTIEHKINLEAANPVVRLRPRNRLVRFTAVAASVLLAVFMFRLIPGNTHKSATAGTTQQTVLPLPGAPATANHDTHTGKALPPAGSSATDFSAQSTVFVYNLPTPHISKDPLPTSPTERKNGFRIYDVVPGTAPELNDGYVERYIVIAVTEDAAVRLPKKLYDLFRCSERPLPSDCAELLSRLQAQSAAPALPASTDFAGLLETIRQVAEYQ